MEDFRWFPKLFRLMAGLLYIPSSNAYAERGFSILRKVHTDERASLSHSTIVSLMSLKFNIVACCFDTVFLFIFKETNNFHIFS